MTEAGAIGIVTIVGALILVVPAVLSRRRRGEPVGRYAAMWAAIFILAFAGALLIGRIHA